MSTTEEANKHVCDVEGCGRSFKLAAHLANHKRSAHGIGVSKPVDGAGGGEGRQARRRKDIRETIVEFVAFADEMRGRSDGDAATFADTIRRDADKIADALAAWCERLSPLGSLVDAFAHGLVVKTFRGFQGLARLAIVKARQRRREAAEEQPYVGDVVELQQVEEPERDFGVAG